MIIAEDGDVRARRARRRGVLATVTFIVLAVVVGWGGVPSVAAQGLCTTNADCDDGNPCTADVCDPGHSAANPAGCVYANAPDGTPCTDGNVCNGNETCQSGVCRTGNPVTCPSLDMIEFHLSSSSGGTVSYNGMSGPLTGTNIGIDGVIGIGTPAKAGVAGVCLGCTLNFTSGNLKSTGTDTWTFNAGGTIMLRGAIDFDGNGVINAGDIPNSTLIAGHFDGDFTVTRSKTDLKIAMGPVIDEKSFALRSFYGYSMPLFQGQLSISFLAPGGPPNGFVSTALLGGGIINVRQGCEESLPAPYGTSCEADGNLCTNDICDGRGSCILSSTVVCSDDGQLCNGPEVCDPASGHCTSGPPAPDGTPCEADGSLCTIDACNGVGSCSTRQAVSCPDDGQVCNGPESCDTGTGLCTSGPPALAATPCDADSNVCTIDQCNGAGQCVAIADAAAGLPCDDGVFCNGADRCDSNGRCNLHDGDPCLGTQCRTCQEQLASCFDPVGTICDDGDPITIGDACDGMGNCAGTSFMRDYAILRWPDGGTFSVPVFLRGKTQVAGHVCGDLVSLRKLGVIDGDAVVPRPNPDVGMRYSYGSEVKGGLFTSGAIIEGIGKVVIGRSPPDTTGNAPQIQRCQAAMMQADNRWASFQAFPATPGFENMGSMNVLARGSATLTLPATPIAVLDFGDLRLRPLSTLTLSGNPTIQQVIVRVNGTRGLRLAGRSQLLLQGLQAQQVIFLVKGRVHIGTHAVLNGTIFGADRVHVAGYSTINGQILGARRINMNASAILNRTPFFYW